MAKGIYIVTVEGLPTIWSSSLYLRPLTVEDGPLLHTIWSDPATMQFWDFPASRDESETSNRIRKSLAVPHDWHAMWCLVLAETDSVIGIINYHHRDVWNRRLEIGFMLARPYWGRGLMREAMEIFIGYCFNELKAHRIELMIDPENLRSIGLANRLAFRQESGPLRDRILVEGKFGAQIVFSLLASDSIQK